jgi:hypothetical protein
MFLKVFGGHHHVEVIPKGVLDRYLESPVVPQAEGEVVGFLRIESLMGAIASREVDGLKSVEEIQ